MRVSNSKIKTWQRCPKRYEYKYIWGLEPRTKTLQLERGSWMHELLEEHYGGGDWEDLHKQRTMEFYELLEELRVELGDLPRECARIMRSYLRYWREEDAQFTVVDTEMDEIVTLPNGLEFRVIIDIVVEDRRTGLLWPWDHKTRKNFESSDGMLLDPQLTNYYTALQIMGYKPLGGVCYNELRTKPPAIPSLLKSGALSKRKNIDTDVYTYMRAIKKHGLDPNDYADILRHIAKNEPERFFRRVKLPKDPPMLKTMQHELIISAREMATAESRGEFRRTFQPRNCKWDCDFKSLCIAELHGSDVKSLIKHGFRSRKEQDEVEERK